jgi:ABC-type lipoprotein release transport system permease subunit
MPTQRRRLIACIIGCVIGCAVGAWLAFLLGGTRPLAERLAISIGVAGLFLVMRLRSLLRAASR